MTFYIQQLKSFADTATMSSRNIVLLNRFTVDATEKIVKFLFRYIIITFISSLPSVRCSQNMLHQILNSQINFELISTSDFNQYRVAAYE